MNIREFPADKLIERAAERLKSIEQFKPPEWAAFVKTGVNRERVPQQDDWWWIRTAAVLRKISLEGPLGVEKLRKEYGGRKNMGHRPERKKKASGSVLRKILQQLEAAGFVEKEKKSGRKLAPKGASFLAEITKEIRKKSK